MWLWPVSFTNTEDFIAKNVENSFLYVCHTLVLDHPQAKYFTLFYFSVDNHLPYNIQEQLIDVYPEFLIELLRTNILEKICHSSFDESDLMLVKIDLNYQKILRLCQLYKNAFQLTYTVIAKKMIKVNTAVVQKFLTTFLNDVKSAMKISEFPHHYEDELINYVLIFNECKVEDEWIARKFTNKLKESNYLHYFILVTHFPNFLYFLDWYEIKRAIQLDR